MTSEAEKGVPILFPLAMTLEGTLRTEVELVASWGQLVPSIASQMSDELEEMEAREAE